MSLKSLNTKTSTLTPTSDRDNSDDPPCLDHLYVPHGRYLGQGLQYLGKGVMIRGRISSRICFRCSDLSASAGRATTSYLRRATFGAQAVAIVSKMLVSISIPMTSVDPFFCRADGKSGMGSTKKYSVYRETYFMNSNILAL